MPANTPDGGAPVKAAEGNPYCFVIGPNGSGKSNLLRALALLQRSAQGELAQEILRQGGIGRLLWDGQVKGISWTVKDGSARGPTRSRQAGADLRVVPQAARSD